MLRSSSLTDRQVKVGSCQARRGKVQLSKGLGSDPDPREDLTVILHGSTKLLGAMHTKYF